MSSLLFLSHCRPPQRVKLIRALDASLEAQLLPFGLSIGDVVTVLAKAPAGPLVLQKDHLEVALGLSLCESLQVEVFAS
jgi:Fe2+ transport system protein FeoA